MNKEKSFWYQQLFPYLMNKEDAGNAIAKGLEKYYYQKELEMKQNVKQINDCIFNNFFKHLKDCESPFQRVFHFMEDLWNFNFLMAGSLVYWNKNHIKQMLFSGARREYTCQKHLHFIKKTKQWR